MHVGYGTIVPAGAVKVILQPRTENSGLRSPAFSAPIRRLVETAREEGRLVPAQHGRKVRAVIITDSNHVILSATAPETLWLRYQAALAREGSDGEKH